jgi:hypothetical protein
MIGVDRFLPKEPHTPIMTVGPHPDKVARLVIAVFGEYGVKVRNLTQLNETLLIDGGRFVARSYRSRGLAAMWLLAVGIVQFYDRDGNMLRTVNLLGRTPPLRVAPSTRPVRSAA